MMEENKKFILYGFYTNRHGHVSIFVGYHPDRDGRIRPYFLELRRPFDSNKEIMKYLKRANIEDLTTNFLGEAVDCHDLYDYGFLGVMQEPILTPFKERVDFVFSLPFQVTH